MNMLERLIGWATSRAPKTQTTLPEPIALDADLRREQLRLQQRLLQHTEELRQLSLAEIEVAALRADGEVIQGTYRPPPRRDSHDGDQGHQPA